MFDFVIKCGILFIIATEFQIENAPIERKDPGLKHFDSAMFDERELVQTKTILDEMAKLAHKTVYGTTDLSAHVLATTQNNFHDNGFAAVSISVVQPPVRIPVAKFLFEGDIVLTPQQARKILQEFKQRVKGKSGMKREKRKLAKDPETRWELPIPYLMNKQLGTDTVSGIKKAIVYWESHTCLKFKEIMEPDGDYIEFFNGLECYSLVGRNGGRQGVSIGGKGCNKLGNIAHEIGHSLGMWHEQSRPSADKHIKLLKDNIINSLLHNFITRSESEVDSAGTPYDLGSVMHYGAYAFTIDWKKPTIQTLIPGHQATIGQRENPSFYDVKAINTAYCQDKCSYVANKCEHGGYPHPAHCEKCICPNGLGGELCQQNENSLNADCGGVIEMRDSTDITINSPSYPDPGYSADQKCSWLIKAPEGERISLKFVDDFQFLCTKTCLDYVEVKNSTDLGLTGMRFCCYAKPEEPILSVGNTMLVIFRSAMANDFGFKAVLKKL